MTDRATSGGPTFDLRIDPSDQRRWVSAFANLPILEEADARTVERMTSEAAFKLYDPGDPVVREGAPAEHFYALLDGAVRAVLRHPSGLEFTPVIFRAPAQFADLAGLSGTGGYGSDLEALTPAIAAAVPIPVLKRALDEDHRLCRRWLDSVVHQFAESIRCRRQQFFGDFTERAVHLLLSWVDAIRDGVPPEHSIEFSLSYAAIARQLGCTRRNAIRVMRELESRDLIRPRAEGWTVDLARLRSFLAPSSTFVHPQRRS
jgi:CRP/FNR family transcriptional regulator, dissimilatory nitrate respiration regulator